MAPSLSPLVAVAWWQWPCQLCARPSVIPQSLPRLLGCQGHLCAVTSCPRVWVVAAGTQGLSPCARGCLGVPAASPSFCPSHPLLSQLSLHPLGITLDPIRVSLLLSSCPVAG